MCYKGPGLVGVFVNIVGSAGREFTKKQRGVPGTVWGSWGPHTVPRQDPQKIITKLPSRNASPGAGKCCTFYSYQ